MADLHIHTLAVRHHRIACDSPVLVQHGMGHDAIALDLDAEWDGLSARLVLGPCGSAYDVLYEGEPVVVPAATLAEAGWLPVSVVGHSGDGTVRVTTERCDHLLRVVESGCVDGSVPPEDQPDLMGQLVEAAERADASADAADKAAASATSAASAATEAAGKVDAAVESATRAAQSATDAAAAATDAAKSANDAAERADQLAEDIPAYVTAAQQAAVEAARAASEADGAATAAGKAASSAAGSAVEAQGSATSASASASAASGSASSAKTSADQAASSAADAAQSAQQVADKYITGAAATTLGPGEQATAQVVDQVLHLGIPQGAKGDKGDTGVGVPDGGAPGQLLSKTDDGTAWVDPPSTGNVPKRTVTDLVAHGEDAYAQKPIEVRIKGRTVENASVQAGNLVTAGKNVLDISGAVKDGWNIKLPNSWLVVGETYTYTSPSTATGAVALFDAAEDIMLAAYLQPGSTATFTVPANCTFKGGINLAGGSDTAIVLGDEQTAMVELGSTPTPYEPPNITTTPLPEVELRSLPNGTCDELVIAQDGTATVERRTQLSGGEVTALPEPTTEPQPPVTLPQLPAPTFNVYHDSQVPSDTSVEYARDINIVIDNLAKQIAGTASAVAVREASTIEEE